MEKLAHNIYKMIIMISIVAIVVIFAIKMGIKNDEFHITQFEKAGYKIENVHIKVEDIDRPYHFIWVSDLHITIPDDEVAEADKATVQARENEFVNENGIKSHDVWADSLPKLLDEAHADGIFFGGDMIDFCSEATVSCLKNGLDTLQTPYMYIRADHDIYPFWLAEQDLVRSKNLQDTVCSYEDIMYMEYEKFIILGFNNSTSQLPAQAVEKLTELSKKSKPIILLTHVPIHSQVDSSLEEASRAAWSDRDLTWGEAATYYIPDDNTQKLLDLIYAPDSTVAEVLGGHLHFSWDGKITEKVHEHVFGPAYQGYIGVITIDNGK